MDNKKLVRQIARLCEKQFRKGYQHGFMDCKNNEITEKEVDEFRLTGMKEGYKKVIHPVYGFEEDSIERLLAESSMSDMNELKGFLLQTIK
jgi:hypothetical protein